MPSSPAPERPTKRCLIAADTPSGPWLRYIELPLEATLGGALQQAQREAPEDVRRHVDWEAAAVGLWGVRLGREAVPGDGDRIEIYRPLTADPRQRRRQNVRSARR